MKFVIEPRSSVQYFNSQKDENNNFTVNRKTTRSLFGLPKIEDIEVLLEEQQKIDMDRFRINFGIDIAQLDECADSRSILSSNSNEGSRYRKPRAIMDLDKRKTGTTANAKSRTVENAKENTRLLM
ncbi:hypothetical protein PPYR_07924 [Photinus pyralis]|uniref:Uncharacterized protein n=1 Tax=Photinus pyralis TaxID=7054 RepID=A0A1Y1LJF5_PHOPY|nr:uncharacterized protein LOC116167554 [Photinus pyralis]KAB0800044.1 hypothetical protein PPYR_07924 [Photinus pyralis]